MSKPEYQEYKRWARMCTKRLGIGGAPPCVLDHDHIGPHVDSGGHRSTKIFIRTRPYGLPLAGIGEKVGDYLEDPDVYHTYEEKAARDKRKKDLQSVLSSHL